MAAVSGPFCARARTGSLSSGRSSFPRLDPMVCTSGPPSPTSPLDTAFSYLPPGLGLSIKGHSAVFLDRDDFEQPDHLGGGGASGARPSPTLLSRRFSASSHTNSNGSRKSSDSSSSSSDTNANGSPTSSLASSTSEDPAAAARRKARTWLAAGEDPGLGAARRALWEDPEELKPPREEEACAADQAARVLIAADEADDEGDDSDDDELDVPILPPVPSPSRPAHATLPPLPSCLRPPLLGRSVSGSSQASSSASVQFAPEQPEPALTYSPSDYERRGQGPVEKLSIKEWVELKSVREAVGLFSGKIAPWTDGIEPPSPTESQGDDSPYTSHFASASASSDASAVLSPKRSCGQLATGAGLLSVGNLASRETC